MYSCGPNAYAAWQRSFATVRRRLNPVSSQNESNAGSLLGDGERVLQCNMALLGGSLWWRGFWCSHQSHNTRNATDLHNTTTSSDSLCIPYEKVGRDCMSTLCEFIYSLTRKSVCPVCSVRVFFHSGQRLNCANHSLHQRCFVSESRTPARAACSGLKMVVAVLSRCGI
jgi:hypothetical protein